MFELEVNNRQSELPNDSERLLEAARTVLEDSPFAAGSVSLAVVDDKTIRRLNRRFLDHDYATDVLSFVFEDEADRIEGEVVVSAETAAAVAADYGCPPDRELLLYVIHGVLHLIGHDDHNEEDRRAMRRLEGHYMRLLGQPLPEEPAESVERAEGGLP